LIAVVVAAVLLVTVRTAVPGAASVPLVRFSVTPSMASVIVFEVRVMSMPLMLRMASSAP
jgi:hypothetical protein